MNFSYLSHTRTLGGRERRVKSGCGNNRRTLPSCGFLATTFAVAVSVSLLLSLSFNGAGVKLACEFFITRQQLTFATMLGVVLGTLSATGAVAFN